MTRPPRPFLFLALGAAAAFSVESWALGPWSWIYGYGSGLETIPALKALAVDGRNFAFWSPFVAGGLDRLAFWGNANPVGPEMLLFATLPTWLGNGLHRFLQYFVAVYFAARVAKEQLQLERRWSALAGVLFGCFSYFTVGALFTLPGVPLMLWLLARAVGARGSFARAAGSGLLMSFLTTFTFGVPYLLFFALLWLLLVQRPDWRTAWRHFAVFGLVLTAVTSPQLLAVVANAPASHRAGWALDPVTLTVDGLFYRQLQFDLFAQDKSLMALTMNLPWAVFLAGGVLALFRRNGPAAGAARIFLRIALIFAILSQKWLWLGVQTLATQLAPFLRGVYTGRFFEIPAAFLIALGLTLAIRMLWAELERARAARAMLAALVGALVLFMVVEPKRHLFRPLGIDDWGEANYRVPALQALRARHDGPFRVASVLPLQPAYAYAHGLETVDGWANLYPAVYRDLWLRVLAPTLRELPATRQIFGADTGRAEDNFILLGADLVRPGTGLWPDEDVHQALRTGFDVDRRFNLDLLRLLDTRYLLSEYPLRSTELRLVHAPATWPAWPVYRSRNTGLVEGDRAPAAARRGPRILRPLRDALEAARRKSAGKDVFVYEVVQPLGRFRFVDAISVEPDAGALLDRLSAADRTTLASTVFVEVKDAAGVRAGRGLGRGTARLVDYAPDTIRLEVSAEAAGFLLIANTWSPYWKAFLDGKRVSLLRVNHAQTGMSVPAGAHRLDLRYLPPYSPSAWLSR